MAVSSRRMMALATLLRGALAATAVAALMAATLPAAAQRIVKIQGPAQAQTQGDGPARESCAGLVASRALRPMPVSFRQAAIAADQVRLTYVGHATFLIESPKGVRIATDYNDYVRPSVVPDVATMNRAHSTHYTLNPDPRIRHVLRGWGDGAAPARHDVTVEDVQIRNVPTNIRNHAGGTQRHGNSIFIFEVGSLCIAHLGHLHHTLTAQQLADIGPVDVVLFPVDGGVTLDQPGMLEVLAALKAPVMIPMHAFSRHSLERFAENAAAAHGWRVQREPLPAVVLARAALPDVPTLMVLPGR